MSFPSIEQYIDALQIPQHTLLDKKLAAGRVETTPMGLPFGRSGQFALTFKIIAAGRDYAFRCFQSERAGMHERYRAISTAVRAAGLPYFVAFEYLDPGIRIQQQNYPALSMDWAQGPPLGVYVEQHHRDPGRLRAVLQQLHGMALALEGARIAHGDIQTGNILVGPSGELKLVDYDGMFVPALTSLGAIETGHPNFQHPQRAALKPFNVTLDRFSFALLHATLTALIESPSLWTTLKSDPEALLLRAADLASPTTSEAFRVLTRLPGSGPTFMRLLAVTSADYTQTPTFSDFLAGRNIPQIAFVPSPAVPVAAAAGLEQDAPIGQLTKLAQLHSQGILTDAEFAVLKAKDARTAQLQKLAQLHSQGVLSDAEFAAAQAKDFDRNATLLAGLSSGTTGSPARTPASTSPRPSVPNYMTPQSGTSSRSSGWEPRQKMAFVVVGLLAALLAAVLIIAGLNASTSSSSAAPITYQTCSKAQSQDQSCQEGLEWSYFGCWGGSRNDPEPILQQLVGGSWKTVKQGFSTFNECEPGFPWTVEFTWTGLGPGVEKYQIYFPAGGGFGETIEPITVTVREK